MLPICQLWNFWPKDGACSFCKPHASKNTFYSIWNYCQLPLYLSVHAERFSSFHPTCPTLKISLVWVVDYSLIHLLYYSLATPDISVWGFWKYIHQNLNGDGAFCAFLTVTQGPCTEAYFPLTYRSSYENLSFFIFFLLGCSGNWVII